MKKTNYRLPFLFSLCFLSLGSLAQQRSHDASEPVWIVSNEKGNAMIKDFRNFFLDNRKKSEAVVLTKAQVMAALQEVKGEKVYFILATYTEKERVGGKKRRQTLLINLDPSIKGSKYLDLGLFQTTAIAPKLFDSSNLCPPPSGACGLSSPPEDDE